MFLPTIPFGGYSGYKLLERTYDAQFEAFARNPNIERNIEYFRANAATPVTAEELVQDRQLLEVTLGAFGLEDEIDKRALIRRVLEEGVIEPGSFANRLTDSRWLEFATNVGFGELGSLLNTQAQQEAIIDLYRTRQFERAIGETDLDLRLALNFRRDIKGLAQEGLATATGWFRVLGNEPLRTVIEGALNLPAEFGQLDVDVQAERIAERSREVFGNEKIDVFSDDAVIEEAIKRYLLTAQIQAGTVSGPSSAQTALTLLQASPIGPLGSANLFASNL